MCYHKMLTSPELITTSLTLILKVVTEDYLMLSNLTLYLVGPGALTPGEWSVYRMHIVDMHVQSMLAIGRFSANVAKIVCQSHLAGRTPRPACTSPYGR